MNAIMNPILAVCAVAMAVCVCGILQCEYMLRRNDWVYVQRMWLLECDQDAYRTLPSYEHMMSRWWVWNIDAFLPGGKHHLEAA